MKVFLGGTVNGSSWRNYVIPCLSIAYFNPVVPDWTEEALEQELYERRVPELLGLLEIGVERLSLLHQLRFLPFPASSPEFRHSMPLALLALATNDAADGRIV